MVVRAPTADAALANAEGVSGRLEPLRESGVIAGFDSPARYLPSRAAQRMRQAALPDTPTLRRNLSEAVRGLPFRADAFEPFVEQVQVARDRPPLTRADLRGTALALKVDSLLLPRHGEWFAMLPLRGVRDAQVLESEIARVPESGAVLLDLKRESDALYRGYRSRALGFSLLGAGAIAALLVYALRSIRRTWDVLLPLAAAIVAVCAILTALGVKLTLFHLVALLLVVGVGSNYSLFFERQNLKAGEPARTALAVLLCNISTCIGFGLLALSRSPVLVAIGGTVALGAFFSMMFAAILSTDQREGGTGG